MDTGLAAAVSGGRGFEGDDYRNFGIARKQQDISKATLDWNGRYDVYPVEVDPAKGLSLAEFSQGQRVVGGKRSLADRGADRKVVHFSVGVDVWVLDEGKVREGVDLILCPEHKKKTAGEQRHEREEGELRRRIEDLFNAGTLSDDVFTSRVKSLAVSCLHNMKLINVARVLFQENTELTEVQRNSFQQVVDQQSKMQDEGRMAANRQKQMGAEEKLGKLQEMFISTQPSSDSDPGSSTDSFQFPRSP